MKKHGFTLAETLITLAIIGVVAALTVPTLMKKYEKHVIETALKENYALLQQAFTMATADGKSYDNLSKQTNKFASSYFDTFINPYLKITKVCTDTSGCWHEAGITTGLNGRPVHQDAGTIGIGWVGTLLSFQLENGAQVTIDYYGGPQGTFGVYNASNKTGIGLYLDVNGNKKPNILGKDIYALAYTSDEGIQPACQAKTQSQINADCKKKKGHGTCCLIKAIQNGWKIDDELFK